LIYIAISGAGDKALVFSLSLEKDFILSLALGYFRTHYLSYFMKVQYISQTASSGEAAKIQDYCLFIYIFALT